MYRAPKKRKGTGKWSGYTWFLHKHEVSGTNIPPIDKINFTIMKY